MANHKDGRRRWPPRVAAAARACAVVLILGLGGCGVGGAAEGGDVVVMAASSLGEVADAVELHLEQAGEHPGDVVVITAGSATLVSQLAAGAEAHVLITADEVSMRRAVELGLVQGTIRQVASNRLVLAVAPGNPGGIGSLDDLARPDAIVGLCAVDVPCGALSAQALQAAGIVAAADSLEPSVRSLAAKIKLGELDAGLVYATDAEALGLAVVQDDGLAGHVNRYMIASVQADPSAGAKAVLDAFYPGGPAATALEALGFGVAGDVG